MKNIHLQYFIIGLTEHVPVPKNIIIKFSDLDLIPTKVLKNCLDILISPITDINNISMETSFFPQKFKEAHYLLKKHLFLKMNLEITGLYPT